jgi:predicted PurR-regulated permease PerM
LTLYALLLLAAAGVALSVWVARPFIPGLAWALAFAVVAHPIHDAIARRVKPPSLAAGLAVAIVLLVIVGPLVFILWRIGVEVTTGVETLRVSLQTSAWATHLEDYPRLAAAYHWIAANVDLDRQLEGLADRVELIVAGGVRNAASGVVQMFTAMIALFYFFRDREEALGVIRSLLPMSNREATAFLERIRAITHATVYGTVVVALVQGALGGLMFWFLGIGGAVVWGVVMGLLAIVPVLGAFVIWVPAAMALALQGEWGAALLLVVWGTVVVGFIDNLLYPVLVGREMQLHTLPVFVAIVGGLWVFGAAGVLLGPMVLAATVALLDILRRRTADGRSATSAR